MKKLLLAVAAFITALGAMAQTPEQKEELDLGYKPYPYNFIQLQGGINTTLTNKSLTKLISPTASIGLGRFFTPAVGARIHVNAWESKGGFRTIADTYKFNYVNSNFDVLVNLNNLFSKRSNHLLNVIFVGGVGLNYAWGNDDMQHILASDRTPRESTVNAWGQGTTREHLLGHNLRAGLLFDANVSKNFNIGLEVDANSLDDRFNSKYNNSDDWMLTAQLSLTFKFGHKKPSVVRPIPAVVRPVEPAPVVKGRAPASGGERKNPSPNQWW